MMDLNRLDKEARRRGLTLVATDDDWIETTMRRGVAYIADAITLRWAQAAEQMTAKAWHTRFLISGEAINSTCDALLSFARAFLMTDEWETVLKDWQYWGGRIQEVDRQVIRMHPAAIVTKADVEAMLSSEPVRNLDPRKLFHAEWWNHDSDGVPRDDIIIQNHGITVPDTLQPPDL